jgi:hypothetical protein
MLNLRPAALYCSTTFFKASALTGWVGLPPSCGTVFFISAHTSLETVTASVLRPMANGATTSAWVPKPMVAPIA